MTINLPMMDYRNIFHDDFFYLLIDSRNLGCKIVYLEKDNI